MADLSEIIEGLNEAQRAWILSMSGADRDLSPDEYDGLPQLFVQFTPDEFCEETGYYLGGGERFWFGHSTARYHGDGKPWHLTAGLNERGLAIRAELQRRAGTKA